MTVFLLSTSPPLNVTTVDLLLSSASSSYTSTTCMSFLSTSINLFIGLPLFLMPGNFILGILLLIYSADTMTDSRVKSLGRLWKHRSWHKRQNELERIAHANQLSFYTVVTEMYTKTSLHVSQACPPRESSGFFSPVSGCFFFNHVKWFLAL